MASQQTGIPVELPPEAQTILDEFKATVVKAGAVFGAAGAGLRSFVNTVASGPRFAENPDPTVSFIDGDPNLPDAKHWGRMRFSELQDFARIGGEADVSLGHQWAVYLFTVWDSDVRQRMAKALGTDQKNIDVPVLGDLRHIRNDIIHNRGVASSKYTAMCVELTWFADGELIVIRPEHVHELEWKVGSITFSRVS